MAAARDALGGLAEWTQAGGTDWGLGIEARCRALLTEGQAAEALYREAISGWAAPGCVPNSPVPTCCTGSGCGGNAAAPTRVSNCAPPCQMLDTIGMEAYAARARRELRAAGGTARRTAVTTVVQLTSQEAQIARLAAEGLSNPEIAFRLFLSPRTVQYHLGKVFTKLGITSRGQLSRYLTGA